MEIYLILSILFLPLLPFIVYLIAQGKVSRFLVIICGLLEVIASFYLILNTWGKELIHSWPILKISGKPFIEYSIWINNYSLAMLFVISIVSLMVRYYSLSYLEKEKRQSWFLVLIGFFTFSMYGLVLSSNLLGTFFFWEWVGLASYLMIGFWYQKEAAASAARKAFMYNKLGDLGFIMAIGIFYYQFGSFDLNNALNDSEINSGQISIWFSIGILVAAFAKSAQLPFSNWLSDAMEGPTPASALIHSATMVTAGIYLLIRCYPFLDTLVLEVCLYLGVVTVLWSGIVALKQNDIKKILAFSTISQLGFMLLGVASGNVQAAFFHLLTHAFFKSSLFLSAGVLINKQSQYLERINSNEDPKDIRFMSGYWQKSPLLSILIILGALALSALPLFSGFLSKEAIIAGLEGNRIVFSLALLATFITAMYSGRIIFHLLKKDTSEIYESNFISDLSSNLWYYFPIAVLVILSFSFIYAINPLDFSNSWLYKGLIINDAYLRGSVLLLIISGLLSVTGLFITYFLVFKTNREISLGKPLDKAFFEGLYIDKSIFLAFSAIKLAGTSFAVTFERRVIERSISFLTYSFVFTAMIFRLFDTYVIDGIVKLSAGISTFFGEITRQFQGGKLRNYLFWLMLFLILGLILIF